MNSLFKVITTCREGEGKRGKGSYILYSLTSRASTMLSSVIKHAGSDESVGGLKAPFKRRATAVLNLIHQLNSTGTTFETN